jgi:DNA replication protein DnaC
VSKADTVRALYLTGFAKEHWSSQWPDNQLDLLPAIKNRADGANSVLLSGVLGAGKTSLLSCFAQALFQELVNGADGCLAYMLPDLFAQRCRYVTHTDLSKIWEREFQDDPTGSEDEFYKAGVLFLDDIGTAPDTQSGRNMARLEALIDYRWSNHLKTFIGSNINLADLQSRKNSQWNRIGRRLGESNWIIYREMKKKFSINVDKLS